MHLPVHPATIPVEIDRDSVSMGDDARPHAERWTVAADTTLAELVCMVVDRRYLPSVSGSVGWAIEEVLGQVAGPDGVPVTSVRRRRVHLATVLATPDPQARRTVYSVVPEWDMAAHGDRDPDTVAAFFALRSSNRYRIHCRYLSQARLLSLEDFASRCHVRRG